jgi:outer membrane protein insertion porin family
VEKLFSGSNFAACRKFLFLLLVLWCTGAAMEIHAESSNKDSVLADIRVELDDAYGSREEWVEMVLCLAASHVRIGERFQTSNIHGLAEALKACRRFGAVHLDTELSQDGLVLAIRVTPFRLIKDIQIIGKYPFFEKRILNTMTLYPGDAYVDDEVEKQPELIAKLYRNYGYIDPKVTLQKVQDPRDGHYVLTVLIEKGPRYRLDRSDVSGNVALTHDQIRRKMKSIGAFKSHFSERDFLEDLERLKKFYIRQGFPDVVIEHRLDRYPETGTVDIGVIVTEGDRYDVTFIGNEAFSNRTLKKDLVLFRSGNRRGVGLRKSIRTIKDRYRKAGYTNLELRVETESVQEKTASVKRLHFIIDEGPRFIVRKIGISGNTAFSEKKLKAQMLTRLPGWFDDGAYDPQQLDQDILAIENLYRADGYLDAKVIVRQERSPDPQSLKLDFEIQEGLQTIVGLIDHPGLKVVSREEILEDIQLKVGEPFSYTKLRNDKKQIAVMVSEKGYPYVRVAGEATFEEDRSRAHVKFRVDQDLHVIRGQTFYAGNFRTRKKILDRELAMQPGDPFSLKKLLRSQQDIRSMDIFRSVTFHPVGLKEKAETINLFTEVEEEKSFYLEASGGYASEKGFYTGTKIGDHNFWGLNNDFFIGGEISETGYNAESRILEPRFLGTRISADWGVFFERSEPFNQTFGRDSRGVDLIFTRKWTKRIKNSLAFKYERRELFGRNGDADEDDDYDQRAILAVTPSITYDSRDSFMNPKKGIFWMTGIDLSRGIENSLDDFYKYHSDLRGYTTPFNRLTLAGRGRIGKVDPYGYHSDLPDDQLFYLGGTSTVRGFDENLLLFDADNDPVGGRFMALGNAEARMALGLNFEFSVFYDIGYLNNTSGYDTSNNVRDAVGVGFRYVTPVGAIGLTYGHKLDPDPNESPGRLHFSIGYTF